MAGKLKKRTASSHLIVTQRIFLLIVGLQVPLGIFGLVGSQWVSENVISVVGILFCVVTVIQVIWVLVRLSSMRCPSCGLILKRDFADSRGFICTRCHIEWTVYEEATRES